MTYASLKPVSKAFVQRKRLIFIRVAAALAVLLLFLTKPALSEGSDGHETLELVGFCLVLICVAGRLWSILYVGGKKNEELVSTGPFSMSQNPLYFFSTVGAVGIGLLYGSLVAAGALGVASFLIFRVTARKEAEYLLGKFGAAYTAYIKATPRFWPNPLLYRDNDELQFSTRALRRTFFDGLYFLAIFPAIELIEYLRETGMLFPAFVTLY
ncbi:MAG: isoprenylcysteine carboxylmethyltransferase family protein [Mesorhizobium sp.]|uniref:methyltransferase family protein n=1 Tax=unclassified Mesorhizobium TaxID=325217 RepID=UPI000F754A6B|nr:MULTISPECIES: isoprenylcysteine carboxylmethyltransferase family protein [unclassified Mesorhizobium]AZO57356.1 isoprenylcysteine carboxylmethyltransferase family protein [Mesorhizobium sp. M8A.F.Ca.ET.057.01.1.1]RWE30899.1 MAG: isoprenylcysteine carboxylmethyltransferase family protein [Mesorhizobium sp.]RWE39810.1 MAG: isoprenylcysteine carboxylmethyltransferase family protein [Mesorhizobium sp.]TJX64527.1 MAG: isoprenylcysteine carboxylmethyltransferase family protein [Mesorhizobium sp.]